MSATLLDYSAVLAEQHIEELRREAAKDRLVRVARQRRRERRRRAVPLTGLRPAAAR